MLQKNNFTALSQVIEDYSSDLGLIFFCIVWQQILFGTSFMVFPERFEFA